jgi:hypothetical protein
MQGKVFLRDGNVTCAQVMTDVSDSVARLMEEHVERHLPAEVWDGCG